MLTTSAELKIMLALFAQTTQKSSTHSLLYRRPPDSSGSQGLAGRFAVHNTASLIVASINDDNFTDKSLAAHRLYPL